MPLTEEDIGKTILIMPQGEWGRVTVGVLREIGATHHVLKPAASVWMYGEQYMPTKEEEEAFLDGYNDKVQLRFYPKDRDVEAPILNFLVQFWNDRGCFDTPE